MTPLNITLCSVLGILIRMRGNVQCANVQKVKMYQV